MLNKHHMLNHMILIQFKMAAHPQSRIAVLLMLFALVACNNQEDFRNPSVTVTPSVGQPWPAPKSVASTSQTFEIDAEDFVFLDPKRCDLLQQAFVRYRQMIFGPRPFALKFRPYRAKAGYLMSLTVIVQKDCLPDDFPTLESDESCKCIYI